MVDNTEYGQEAQLTTDGVIATGNLESSRRRFWSRFWGNPLRDEIAETIVELEQFTAQFVGDLTALDRLEALAGHLTLIDPVSARTCLIQAKVASMTHRFADARRHLADAVSHGAPVDTVDRLSLTIDQACGMRLEAGLSKRFAIATASRRIEDRVPLGALLAELGRFDEADRTYRQALDEYRDVSPFAVAWVCFQLGQLWGELAQEPQPHRAACWYERALHRLPGYVKARVHLAEIYLSSDRATDAEQLLMPALESGDPEVPWRLAGAMAAQDRSAEAETQIKVAKAGFDELLARHPLAFADHAAAFYADTGNNLIRALELARVNVSNRPTLRAFEQALAIALRCDTAAAAEVHCEALKRWGDRAVLRLPALALSASAPGSLRHREGP
jgi:tetratricopeptide (TPR) repeat protein